VRAPPVVSAPVHSGDTEFTGAMGRNLATAPGATSCRRDTDRLARWPHCFVRPAGDDPAAFSPCPGVHIVVFHQHYTAPEGPHGARHYALLEHWRHRHEVTLLSAAYNAPSAHHWPRVPQGVRHVRIRAPYRNQMGQAARAVSFVRYAAGAVAQGLRIPRPDIIVGVSSPLFSAAAGAAVAAFREVPFVLDMKDIWPDFPVQMGAMPRPLARGLYALERALYRRSAHVVTLSPDMTDHVVAHDVSAAQVTTLYNGTDPRYVEASRAVDLDALRRRHGLVEKRVVLYAGSFGRANNLPLLLRLAEHLAGTDSVLVCIGEGYGQDALRTAAERLPSLRLLPPVAHTDVYAWFRLADLSLVAFLPLRVLGTTSPAKLFDSLACGTPVVIFNDGWMRTLVEQTGCGFFVGEPDPEACARHVAALLGDSERLVAAGARAADLYAADYAQMFDRDRHAARYEALFGDVAPISPATEPASSPAPRVPLLQTSHLGQ